MTETQYLLGWLVYLAGGTGCMLGLWLLIRNWNFRLRRALMALFAIIVYLPGLNQSDTEFWSPAFLTTIFDALTYGTEVAMRNGKVVAVVSGIALLVAVALPAGSKVKAASKKTRNKISATPGTPNQGEQRKEPIY